MAREISLNHICKIEGHAHLNLKIRKDKVEKCQLEAAEGARFFESLVLNKKVEDIQEIVSRICGICSSAHSVASIQALEEGLGIKPSEQQKTIRKLLMIGERIRSHATHLYFLSLPDYYGADSALSMANKHKDKINDAVSLISIGNKIVETFGGRDIHPFLAIKEKMPEIKDILKPLEDSKDIIIRTIKLFSKLKYPALERETDYLSLRDKDYATISGRVVSSSGLIDDNDYKKHLKENIREYSTSKFVLQVGEPFMTGAMARVNNNHDRLDGETKKFLGKLPLKNPYHNNIAQSLEMLHLVNEAVKIIKNCSLEKEKTGIKIKQGHGVSAVEAPRGTLFHEYKIDKNGRISYCNIITPTTQNLTMIEMDIIDVVNKSLSQKDRKEKIVNKVEKLIRAYDPCFSCSTHFLKVRWL